MSARGRGQDVRHCRAPEFDLQSAQSVTDPDEPGSAAYACANELVPGFRGGLGFVAVSVAVSFFSSHRVSWKTAKS